MNKEERAVINFYTRKKDNLEESFYKLASCNGFGQYDNLIHEIIDEKLRITTILSLIEK